jgi:hypothetical protein
MFGLGVLRHRNFELGGWRVRKPVHPRHRGYVRGWRHGEYRDGPYVAAYGSGGGKATVPEMQEAMGVTWTDEREELTEAIPPAYAEWIGRAFLNREDDMSDATMTSQDKPRGKCTGCKFDYQLGQGKGEHKGQLVVRKHLSRTGPGECDGSRKPPAIDLGEATGDADAWQAPAPVEQPRIELGPWVTATYDGRCDGNCGGPITSGEEIRADGQGGWLCESCGEDAADEPECQHKGGYVYMDDNKGHSGDFCLQCGEPAPENGPYRMSSPDEIDAAMTARALLSARVGLSLPPEIVTAAVQPQDIERAAMTARALLSVPSVDGDPYLDEPTAGAPPAPDPHEREATSAIAAVQSQAMSWAAPAPVGPESLPPVSGQPEPKRDRWGRYLILGAPHTRATTFAKLGANTKAIEQWGKRNVIRGLTLRSDLLMLANGLEVKRDREQLNSIAAQAEEAAGHKIAANIGTAYHAFSERLDAGLITLADVPEAYRPRVAQYAETVTQYGLTTRPEWIERTTGIRADQVGAPLPVAGTLDRIFQLPSGDLVIGDLKTGSDLSYGEMEIEVQLAVYAHGVNTHGLFDWNTDAWQPAPGHVRTDIAIVIHLPADGIGCTLYVADIERGWRDAQRLGPLQASLKEKKRFRSLLPSDLQPAQVAPPAPVLSGQVEQREEWVKAVRLFSDAATRNELATLYQYAMDSGKYSADELSRLAQIGSARLASIGV